MQAAVASLENGLDAGEALAPLGERAGAFDSLDELVAAVVTEARPGDHVLVTDSVYRPARNFCDNLLARYGVEVSYYDPMIGAGIESLIKANVTAFPSTPSQPIGASMSMRSLPP